MRMIEIPRLSRFGFTPPNALRFGGGGRVQQTATPAITSAPAPAVAAPATSTAAEVVQAQQDARRQALKKKGFSKTTFAGDTGGWTGTNTTPGPANPKIAGTPTTGAKTLGGT